MRHDKSHNDESHESSKFVLTFSKGDKNINHDTSATSLGGPAKKVLYANELPIGRLGKVQSHPRLPY